MVVRVFEKGSEMSENSPNGARVKISINVVEAVIMFFILFWATNGWNRVDCALGIPKSCGTLESKYELLDEHGKEIKK